MIISVMCPHCHTRVTVLMIEVCEESVCLKSCHIAEVDWSEFAAVSGEQKTEPMPLFPEDEENKDVPDFLVTSPMSIRHIV
jgi:uncharacterized radical SAM superfamily protein